MSKINNSKMADPQDKKWSIDLDEQLLQDLYAWIDQIPLSRPKKRIERDFSDGGFFIFF